VFILCNTLGDDGINLTTSTDSDNDGLLSDESTKVHSTIISYNDQTQEVTDIAWTKTRLGKGDDDHVLESGEKCEITVDVSQLSNRLVADGEFRLEVRPARGSSIVIERTIPSVVDKVNDLN
jgi:archaellin